MSYLGLDISELKHCGALHTAREIAQQPVLWLKTLESIRQQKAGIDNFLDTALQQAERIILTGAGTSAYIGLSLKSYFQERTGILTEAIATTDIVTHPSAYFMAASPVLLVSFARSGDSPESVEAIRLADELNETCFHLIITCNSAGSLATYPTRSGKYVFTLPEEANDRSLAMTSSYSSMLLAGLLIAGIGELESLEKDVHTVAGYARRFIDNEVPDIKEIASLNFKRAVFLGAGPFAGTATEAQLKLQELTDGKIICKNDTYLGFRHGPKSVTDATTLMMYFFSPSDKHAFKYEKDLVAAMRKGTTPLIEIGVSETALSGLSLAQQYVLAGPQEVVKEETMLAICYILPAQLLGFFKSLQLGLKPDAPSETNAITRVVEGVNIYTI